MFVRVAECTAAVRSDGGRLQAVSAAAAGLQRQPSRQSPAVLLQPEQDAVRSGADVQTAGADAQTCSDTCTTALSHFAVHRLRSVLQPDIATTGQRVRTAGLQRRDVSGTSGLQYVQVSGQV